MVRGAFGASNTGAPRFLLPLVALLSPTSFAVNFLLERAQPCQVCFAPKPHGPAIAYAQLWCPYFASRNPAVQRHHRNAYGARGLLRVTGLGHYVIYIAYLSYVVKLFVLAGTQL